MVKKIWGACLTLGNIAFPARLITIRNMLLKHWVEFFEDLKWVRGRSDHTVQAYRHDLELYQEFLEQGKSLDQIFVFLAHRGLSPRSQARVISSIRTYLRFCLQKGENIPSLHLLRPPRVKTQLPKPLHWEEFEKLHHSAHTPDVAKTARNRVMLWLLYGMGCRVSELTSLNLEDFKADQGLFKIMGKGRKERLVPVPQVLLLSLHEYLQQHRPLLLKKNTNEQSFLINDRGHRPSRIDVWRWLDRWSKDAGFAETIHPHRFRHGFATSLLANGADLRSIQMLLGHSSIQTTQIYTQVAPVQLVREVDEYLPVSPEVLPKDTP